jgi:DNA-binding transcriptional ArsR family regulator
MTLPNRRVVTVSTMTFGEKRSSASPITDEKLSEGPLSVSRLAAPLDVTLTAVVQHLQVLEESGLVDTEKVGRVRTCRIETVGFSVLERWIADHRSMWERRLDRLGDLLTEPDDAG